MKNRDEVNIHGVAYKRVVYLHNTSTGVTEELLNQAMQHIKVVNIINEDNFIEIIVSQPNPATLPTTFRCDGTAAIMYSMSDKESGFGFEEQYILTEVEELSNDPNNVMYKLTGINSLVPLMRTPCHFSNYGKPTEISEVVTSLAKESGITLSTTDKFTTLNQKIEFITAPNDSLEDSIFYLLGQSYSSAGVYFMYWSRHSNTYVLGNLKDSVSVDSPIFEPNAIIVPTEDKVGQQSFVAHDITEIESISATDSLTYTVPSVLKSYNTLYRTWSSSFQSINNINNSLPDLPPDSMYCLQSPHAALSIGGGGTFERINGRPIYGGQVTQMLVTSNAISFTIDGNVARNVGQTLFLQSASGTEAQSQYTGHWLITALVDFQSSKEYIQKIEAIRVFQQKPPKLSV